MGVVIDEGKCYSVRSSLINSQWVVFFTTVLTVCNVPWVVQGNLELVRSVSLKNQALLHEGIGDLVCSTELVDTICIFQIPALSTENAWTYECPYVFLKLCFTSLCSLARSCCGFNGECEFNSVLAISFNCNAVVSVSIFTSTIPGLSFTIYFDNLELVVVAFLKLYALLFKDIGGSIVCSGHHVDLSISVPVLTEQGGSTCYNILFLCLHTKCSAEHH